MSTTLTVGYVILGTLAWGIAAAEARRAAMDREVSERLLKQAMLARAGADMLLKAARTVVKQGRVCSRASNWRSN